MNRKTLLPLCGMLFASLMGLAQTKISVDVTSPKVKVGNMHYGLFFEDINHAADGGLYAELIRNRSFEDNERTPEYWSAVSKRGAKVKLSLSTTDLLNSVQGHALQMTVSGASESNKAGVSNAGFWGINVVKGNRYKVSFWARRSKSFKGALSVALESSFGTKCYGSAKISEKLGTKWKKYTAEIVADGDDANARFSVLANGDGTLYLDVVSVFPPTFKNRENGCRQDLAQLLADTKPSFLRFPGGCFVEGQEGPENAFRWERTIGPIELRPGHKNVNWGYRTSDGLGYHEYLQLAEDLGAKPLYVVNVGIWHGGFTPIDSMQYWIDEALAAIEYANGDVSTKYGKMRADNGHPQPFGLEYVEIGNENYQPGNNPLSDNYPTRYRRFYNAIKEKYPEMHLIGNVAAWGTDSPKWQNGYPVEIVDEHYYRNPAWFASAFDKYDNYDRKGPKVYVGEYAVTKNFGTTGNLNAALGEAVYMMGMENNSDVVTMASYAPIFVNENNEAWKPDMIRFNSSSVCCTPSYYVQRLMSENLGSHVASTIVKSSNDNMENKEIRLGLGTWKAMAKFDSAFVYVDGKKLMDENFTKRNDWCDGEGVWNIKAGMYEQMSRAEACTSIWNKPFAENHYTYKVKAFKEGGDEGILILFNYEDADNYAWVNIGTSKNSRVGIEQAINGSRITVAREKFVLETGKWYEIRVDVDGEDVVCFIDGEIVCSGKLRKETRLFASSTFDSENGDLFVKVVNFSKKDEKATISFNGAKAQNAKLIQLTSENGTDENTMANSQKVIPSESDIDIKDGGIEMEIPAFSLNIFRVKTK